MYLDLNKIRNKIIELKTRTISGSYNNLTDNQKKLYKVIKTLSDRIGDSILTKAEIRKKCNHIKNFDLLDWGNVITDFCYNKVNMNDNDNKYLLSPKAGEFIFKGFDWNSRKRIDVTWKISAFNMEFIVGLYKDGVFLWDFNELETFLMDNNH